MFFDSATIAVSARRSFPKKTMLIICSTSGRSPLMG